MTGRFKRGGARGGGFKSGYARKRAPPEENDDATSVRVMKKSKGDGDEEHAILLPKLETDEENNPYVALKAGGTRRITISEFKGTTLVSIREYYADPSGDMKPGKKGISLSIDQYNALLAAAPLLESVLEKREQKTVRPEYDGPRAEAVKPEIKDEEEEEAEDNEDE